MRALSIALVLVGCAAEPATRRPLVRAESDGTQCDVTDYGAAGDGVSDDTAAVQAALDDCAGGGTAVLPSGTYLVGPLLLSSHLTLRVEAGATLQGTSDATAYDRGDGAPPWALVNGDGLTDVSLAGTGTIDGAGQPFWDAFRAAQQAGTDLPARPLLIQITRSSQLRVSDLTLQNSPMFHLSLVSCDDVAIDGVTILAPADSPNTDGIDPKSCRHVRITGCRISVGDDDVAVTSNPSSSVPAPTSDDTLVADCQFEAGHGVSIGSPTSGGVRGLTVERCSFDGTTNGIRVKSYRGRGGVVERLRYRDLVMNGVANPILLTAYYPKIPASDDPQPVTATTPIYRDIEVHHLAATGAKGAGAIVGLPEASIDGVLLDDVSIAATTGLEIRNAHVARSAASIQATKGDAFILEANADVTDVP